MSYTQRDQHILDYALFELDGVKPYPGGGLFRGPKPIGPNFISCIGAAQTFGCFVQDPFPMLLSRNIGLEVLNLGHGGAGPTFHNSNQAIMRYINLSKLVIVQVFSGRSQSNSEFKTSFHGMEGYRLKDNKQMIAAEFYAHYLRENPSKIESLVQETRTNYVKDMITLLCDIKVPKILFWFSVRKPKYFSEYRLPLYKFWGAFPQFVNDEMINLIIPYADDYVECISSSGLPQKLYDKDGRQTSVIHSYNIENPEVRIETENNYYPSPEMHIEAAKVLTLACNRFLKNIND